MAAFPENFSKVFVEFHLDISPMGVQKTPGKNITSLVKVKIQRICRSFHKGQGQDYHQKPVTSDPSCSKV